MTFEIVFFSEQVRAQIAALPRTLLGRFTHLGKRIEQHGPNLGEPHTKALGDGLFEMRLKGAEGIGRVFYCALVDRHVVILHGFVKKTRRLPLKELSIARRRLGQVRTGWRL